jgi:EAL domain-containing protein (putative c-di-GMP-specific phosphodiesterase class I)
VAVNLSTIQLASPGLLEEVQGALARHRLEARHLTLEITESTAMQKAEESLAILNRLPSSALASPSTTSAPATPACLPQALPRQRAQD